MATLNKESQFSRLGEEIPIAVFFFLVATVVGLSNQILEDEGHLTFIGARIVWDHFIDGLFFQKIHPTLSVINAPFAAVGKPIFLEFHILMASLAVFLTGRTARRFGATPWLAALLMASSPIFLICASTGNSNSSGTFVVILVVYLYTSSSRRLVLLSGLIAGAGLWVRYEQFFYLFFILLHAVIVRRDVRYALCFFLFPFLYALSGAIYHSELLWMLKYPPGMISDLRLAEPGMIGTPSFSRQAVIEIFISLFYVCPVWPLVLLVPYYKPCRHVTQWMFYSVVTTFAFIVVLPLAGHYFNFEHIPRYFSHFLPFFALFSSQIPKKAFDSGLSALPVFLVTLVLLGISLAAGLIPHYNPLVWYIILPLVFFFAAWIFRGRIRIVVFILVCLAGPIGALIHPASISSLESTTSRLRVGELDVAVRELQSEIGRVRIFTNSNKIGLFYSDMERPVKVIFIPGYDIETELYYLSDRENGQYGRILESMGNVMYGKTLWGCEFPKVLNKGDLLVLDNKSNIEMLVDLESWKSQSTYLGSAGKLRFWKINENNTIIPKKYPPAWLPRGITEAPCLHRDARIGPCPDMP